MIKSLQNLQLSELQLSLLVIGLAGVLIVWGYNAWQEHKQRTLAKQIFRGEQDDVLMGGADTAPETSANTDDDDIPVLCGIEEDRENHADSAAFNRIEPMIGTPTATPETTALPIDNESGLPSAGLPDAAQVDPMIDCIARLTAPEFISVPLFWVAQRHLFGSLEKRLHWFGLDENGGQWRRLDGRDTASYRHLVGALQIADRRGPIGAAELELFAEGVRELARDFRAHAETPTMTEVHAQARALDEFCAGVDWRLALNLVARSGAPMPLPGVRQLAESNGLRNGDDSVLHAIDATGRTLFTLSSLGDLPLPDAGLSALTGDATLNGVTLSLDVPRVADASMAFDRMLSLAAQFAQTFDALLVDDQRNELSEAMLAMIRVKIGEFQRKMATHDIPPGSRRALRLYS